MQQRSQFYTLQQILSADLLNAQVYALAGDANSLQTVLGSTQTLVSNLILSPTSPASLILNLTNGFVLSLQPVDASSYGSLPADTNQVLQLGYNQQTTVSIGNDLEAGQAQYVLIEVGFQQIDSDPQVLPYVNISNPSVPFNGPGNSGIAQDTIRNEVAVITVKAGTPATAGSEVPPVVDAGNVALAYVDLQAGQVTITADQILDPDFVVAQTGHGSPSAVLTGLLNSHHAGLIGQAPQVMLGITGPIPQEVQGFLPVANMVASNIIGAVSAFRLNAGNPNGVLAGNSNVNNAADMVYDYINNALYMCTTTGSSSTAVWTSTNLPASHAFNLKTFDTSTSYTPTAGTKYIAIAVCGGGGGGAGNSNGAGNQGAPGGGGGASTAVAILPTNGLTFPATITIGAGGAGGLSGTGALSTHYGQNGNNSQFSTAEIGTSLTGFAGEGGYIQSYIGITDGSPGARGGGNLQSAVRFGTITISSVQYPYFNVFGSAGQAPIFVNGVLLGGAVGGASALGGGGAGGSIDGLSFQAQSGGIGSGGGGAGFSSGSGLTPGANGSSGAILVCEFVGN